MSNLFMKVAVRILTVVFFTSGIMTFALQTSYLDDKYVSLEGDIVVVDNSETVEEINQSSLESVKYETLNYNDTIIGNRISIGNILNNNLMNDTGDNFYLNHDINGNYNGIGVPYIDFRTDFNTRKTIIYAHSSMNGNGPFQVLQNYHNNIGYYYSNPYIDIYYNGNHYRYLIFSVYVSIADNDDSEGLEYFNNMDYDDISWGEVLTKYKNNSEYDTGVSVSSNDKILILQTCSMDPNYYEKYYRYNLLIMGKLV